MMFLLHNPQAIEYVLEQAKYQMLKPHKFLTLLHERKSGRQVCRPLLEMNKPGLDYD